MKHSPSPSASAKQPPLAQGGSSPNPYARAAADIRPPPQTFLERLRFLGPSFLLVGGVVGAGEIILTTTMGATVGFVLFWWLLLSCWCKSMAQAELARYTIDSGEPVMTAFARLPGKIPGPNGPMPWFSLLQLFLVLPALLRSAGIYGGAGMALALLLPFANALTWTILLTSVAAIIVLVGQYRLLERVLLVMVVSFSLITLFCVLIMQTTDYAFGWEQIKSGFTFDFPLAATAIALATFSATGVNSTEIMNYTYWCVEKGYARFAGPKDGSPDWAERAKGWIKVMHLDAWLTLLMLTVATIPFYLLGASVLHRAGTIPDGPDTIRILTRMYTETLGPWAADVFLVGAFCVLFSTVITALAGGARTLINTLESLNWIPSDSHPRRKRYWRIYTLTAPIAQVGLFHLIGNPVLMLVVAGVVFAAMNPIIAGGTLYLRYQRLDRRLAPSLLADLTLWGSFLFMTLAALFIIFRQLAS